MDRNELKIQALTEGFSNKLVNLTVDYETRIADLRIEITELSQANESGQAELEARDAQISELQAEIERLKEINVREEADADPSDHSD